MISLKIPGKKRPNLLSLFHTYLVRKTKEDRERRLNNISRHHRGFYVYDDYGDEYEEEMEQLRRFYGGCFPNSSRYILDPLDDDDWDDDDYDDDYYVDDDGSIIFPPKNNNIALRPGEYRRSAQDMDDYWNKMSKFNEHGKHKHTKHRGSRGSKKAKVIDINDGDALESCLIYFYEDYHDKYNRTEFNSLYEFDQYCEEMGFKVPPYVAEQIAYGPVNHCCLNPIAKEHGVLEVMREETYGEMFYEACETSELSN